MNNEQLKEQLELSYNKAIGSFYKTVRAKYKLKPVLSVLDKQRMSYDISKDKYGNYSHSETGLVFDFKTKKVIGRYGPREAGAWPELRSSYGLTERTNGPRKTEPLEGQLRCSTSVNPGDRASPDHSWAEDGARVEQQREKVSTEQHEDNGFRILPLTKEDIEQCNQYKFDYDVPFNLNEQAFSDEIINSIDEII